MGLRVGCGCLNGVSVDFRPCGFTWLSWFLDWYSSCLDYRIWHLGCLLGWIWWFAVVCGWVEFGCYIGGRSFGLVWVHDLDCFGCFGY